MVKNVKLRLLQEKKSKKPCSSQTIVEKHVVCCSELKLAFPLKIFFRHEDYDASPLLVIFKKCELTMTPRSILFLISKYCRQFNNFLTKFTRNGCVYVSLFAYSAQFFYLATDIDHGHEDKDIKIKIIFFFVSCVWLCALLLRLFVFLFFQLLMFFKY